MANLPPSQNFSKVKTYPKNGKMVKYRSNFTWQNYDNQLTENIMDNPTDFVQQFTQLIRDKAMEKIKSAFESLKLKEGELSEEGGVIVPRESKVAHHHFEMAKAKKKYNETGDQQALNLYKHHKGELEKLKESVDESDESIFESAPPGMEDWVLKHKAQFKKEYGDEKGEQVLYAVAWKRYKKKHH